MVVENKAMKMILKKKNLSILKKDFLLHLEV